MKNLIVGSRLSFLLFFFFLFLFFDVVRPDIGEFDEYWKKRAEAARDEAHAAYNPDPIAATNDFNKAVHKALDKNETISSSSSSNRRGLWSLRRGRKKKYGGPCRATNPIDRCWRCRSDWAHHRKRLATCAKGFGRRAGGGRNGRFYVVTDPSDHDLVNPRPGTLRHAVIQTQPLWIVFARDMIIRLSEELIVNSYKTIDGRGARIHIAYGAQITIQFVHHIILHNLHIHDIKPGNGGMIRDSVNHYGFRTRSDGDAISIYGSSNIWIDHISMSNCADGLIDAIMGSTAITVSNCHMTNHDDVFLFGASDSYSEDALMQVTVAFNHFGRGLVQRMPRCRWGFVHVVNNDYTHWLMYAVGGSSHPTIVSQGNRYIAPPNRAAKEVTHRDYVGEWEWRNWHWRSEGDLMLNGAFFVQSGKKEFIRKYTKQDMIKAKPGTFVKRLTRFAGTLRCRVERQC
ncbi:hypothetical protein KFK09_027712 [Dendrobium nobile]|uniref:Pectate lyase n=1 Tax=Dendrobium nobile TaxID=94219 RepID=A0A8T3A1G4_DENNO|nr:hypothetical protein KFK09_027712 [Dendrobium nobile]